MTFMLHLKETVSQREKETSQAEKDNEKNKSDKREENVPERK